MTINNLHFSRFSFIFEREGKYLIYNSRLNCFLEVSQELYMLLLTINMTHEWQLLDTDVLDLLIKQKIFVKEDEDDDYIDELEFQHNIYTYSSARLNITIATTTNCNLRCPYCFEKDKNNTLMSQSICDSILDFLSQHKYAKEISICWYGGEPLLNPTAIEYLLEKITRLESLKLIGHSIISNTTIINNRIIDLFKRYPLNMFQVTLDGNKESHDKRRYKANMQGTFDLILCNLHRLVKELPNTRFDVRVNIDKTNSKDYIEIRDLFKKEFPTSKNIFIYPGILRKYGDCDLYNFFTSKDTLEFFEEMDRLGYPLEIYPSKRQKGCSATCTNNYVIGPEGELYNCWEDVGNKKLVIGSVLSEKMNNQDSMIKYIKHGVPFSNEKCRKCGLFPICNGGCPKKRLSLNKDDLKSLCYIFRQKEYDALYDFLYRYYKRVKNLNAKKMD